MNQGQGLPQGYRLQEYEIERALGAGGFGITYLATDTVLDRRVAIKEYFPSQLAARSGDGGVTHYADSPDNLAQYETGRDGFIDEARTLARFEHPNVIRVVRYLEQNNTAYIVMEYADGEELSDIIKRDGPLSEDFVRKLLGAVLDGLELVHAQGLLHRDIKPHNIIIRPDGTPVLIDFGAARQAIGVLSRSISTIVTPGFAPIEQYSARGNQGPWTDIYALGGVAYCCLTGKVPAEATERIREDHLAPIGQLVSAPISGALADAITWALRPEEADRPQTVEAFKAALAGQDPVDAGATVRIDRAAPRPEPSKQPAEPERRGLEAWKIVAGLAVVAIVGGIALLVPQINSLTDRPGSGEARLSALTPEPTPEPAQRPPATGVQAAKDKPPQRAAPSRPQPEPKPVRNAPQQRERGPSRQEVADFKIVAQIDTPAAYRLFLRKHPAGQYADEARQRSN